MRVRMKGLLTILTAALTLGTLGITSANADGVDFKGKLEIQTPVYYQGTPDRSQDRSPMVIGAVSFPNLVGSLTPSFEYRYNINKSPKSTFWKENRFILTLETPLNSQRDWILFGFWERRDFNYEDRYVVGLRHTFKGKL